MRILRLEDPRGSGGSDVGAGERPRMQTTKLRSPPAVRPVPNRPGRHLHGLGGGDPWVMKMLGDIREE